jgi:hypothetical protein
VICYISRRLRPTPSRAEQKRQVGVCFFTTRTETARTKVRIQEHDKTAEDLNPPRTLYCSLRCNRSLIRESVCFLITNSISSLANCSKNHIIRERPTERGFEIFREVKVFKDTTSNKEFNFMTSFKTGSY